MKARLIRDNSGVVKLLCTDGTICMPDYGTLRSLLFDFRNASYFTGKDGNWLSSVLDMSMFPGETLAYVADDLSLVVLDSSEFSFLLNDSFDSYISLPEYAEKVDKSVEIIKVLCRSGRMMGAKKLNGRWFIPEDAPYPVPKSRRHDGISLMKNKDMPSE